MTSRSWVYILLVELCAVFCLASQPVAYWPLTNSSGQTVCDLSSNALHGVCFGTEWAGTGEALEFLPPESGVLVRTKTAAPLDCPQSFTFTAWIRPSSLSGYRMLVCNGRQDSAASGYNFYLNGQALGLILYTERKDRYKAEVKAPLVAGRWTHVAVSYEAEGKAVFYVDGRKIGETSAAGRVRYRPNQCHPSVHFTLGRVAAYSEWFYEGLMREVKVFGSALAAEEVAAEYNNSSMIASLNPEIQEQRFARILTGEIRGRILDETGQPVTALVTLSDTSGKKYGPNRLFYSSGVFFATQGV
ncbi:MAG: LamG domain-containing protein, partial [Kiritimatiellae bacterium]|nr:LamG domain-containing protein [Kiritimatiellia bacterium]